MQHLGLPELLVILVVGMLLSRGRSIQAIAEALSQFKNGGPGSPSHPIPGDDSRILLRKRKRKSDA